MRRRTFEDRKFGTNDANSDAYRDNWERMFGNDCGPSDSQLPSAKPEHEAEATDLTDKNRGCDGDATH